MIVFPQRMKRLTAVVMRGDADTLTRRLLNLGVMDFIDVQKVDREISSQITSISQESSSADLEDIRHRIEMFLQNAHMTLPQADSLNADDLQTADPEKLTKELDKLASDIQKIRDEQQAVQQEIHRFKELHRQISLFQEITEIALEEIGAYVEVKAGSIGKSRFSSLERGLKGFPAYLYRGSLEDDDTKSGSMEYPVLLIFMKRDADRIEQLLDRVQWKTIEIPREFQGLRDQALEEIDQKIRDAEKRQQELSESADTEVAEKREWLETNWKNLRMSELYSSMQTNYGKTGETVIFSGWIPANRKENTEKAVLEASRGRCFMEWADPEKNKSISKTDVPVKLKHAPALSPFQWLVENYSVPRYGSIDPTILVFATYLVMFGLMFGDAGHGAVLILAGWLITRLRKRRHKQEQAGEGGSSDSIAKLGQLILWCGVSAVVMGVLFGSYFGYAWIPPLWFNYHSIVSGHGGSGGVSASYITSIYDILGITIKFGIAIIAAGIVLNCINRIRAGDWFHLLFDNGGLLAGWFYAGGVSAAFYFVSSGYLELPSAISLLFSVGLPLLVFAAKAPLEYILEQRKGAADAVHGGIPPGKIMDFFMDWVVELLELFTSYLSNTLSFMRIAGLGIAHVSLMVAFFQIAESIGSTAGSIAVLILGNAVVIVLEGLSAGIQALRLHYYEFFSKYFCGSGRVYRPISLRRTT